MERAEATSFFFSSLAYSEFCDRMARTKCANLYKRSEAEKQTSHCLRSFPSCSEHGC